MGLKDSQDSLFEFFLNSKFAVGPFQCLLLLCIPNECCLKFYIRGNVWLYDFMICMNVFLLLAVLLLVRKPLELLVCFMTCGSVWL